MNKLKKAFCYQKMFWPFSVWINCSGDHKNFANSRPSASNFKSFTWSLGQFFSHSRSEQFWKQKNITLLSVFRWEQFFKGLTGCLNNLLLDPFTTLICSLFSTIIPDYQNSPLIRPHLATINSNVIFI